VKIILKEDCINVDAKNYKGETALHMAVTENYVKIIDLLLISTFLGDTVLHLAVEAENKELIQHVIRRIGSEKQEDIILYKNSEGNMAIHGAVERGNREIFKLFSEQNYNFIKAETASENTLLHLTVKRREKEIIEFLLQTEQGGQSCINTRNSNRETPLRIDSKLCDIQIAKLLIANGADIFSTACRIMLHYTVDTYIKNEDKIKYNIDYYMKRKTEINKQDRRGITALHLAARRGCTLVVNPLIDKGSDTKISDEHGRRFIHYLASGFYRKWQEAVKYILGNRDSTYKLNEKLFDELLQNKRLENVDKKYIRLYKKIAKKN
jgi:ankyrin repeat protein